MPSNILNQYLCHDDGVSPHPVTDSFDWITSLASLPAYPFDITPASTGMTALDPQKPARKISRKTMITMLLIVLPLGGLWQIGQGAYIHAKAVLAQILLEAAWVDTLNGHEEVKPWPWADTWPIGRLTVPRLGISRIVLAGASGESLAFGPGLFSGNPLPDNSGNTVIAGHRDTHFKFLQDLKPGDVITLQTPDARIHDYRISEINVVHESDTHYMEETDDSLLTLVTCYPFDAIVPGGPLRYLVVARQRSSMLL